MKETEKRSKDDTREGDREEDISDPKQASAQERSRDVLEAKRHRRKKEERRRQA